MTVQELVNSALRLIQALDAGDTPSTTESEQALAVLNQILASLSASGAPVYKISLDVLALTGAASYSLSFRPVRIRSVAVVAGGVAKEVAPLPAEAWSALPDKVRTGMYARHYFYDGGWPQPLLYLWPVPKSGGSLELYTLRPLQSFLTLSETISLPPGYEHALRYALAVALAPEYGNALSQEVLAGAASAMTTITTLNTAVLGPALPPQVAPPAA